MILIWFIMWIQRWIHDHEEFSEIYQRTRLVHIGKPEWGSELLEREHCYSHHRANIDKSLAAQRAKGRNLCNKNNCLLTNTSTFEAVIPSIKNTRLWSQAKELASLALSHFLWYWLLVGWRFAAALLPRLFRKNPRSHHKGATCTNWRPMASSWYLCQDNALAWKRYN